MKSGPSSASRFRLLGVCFSLALFLMLVVFAELAGWCVLRFQGRETFSLFYKGGAVQEGNGVFDRRISYSYLDPLLSHAHNEVLLKEEGLSVQPGFVAYGASDEEDRILIVTLGGSTTDPTHRHLWPSALAGFVADEGISVRVLNGGVAGYSSNQELIKLVRDVLPLKPDLVISLNGINDLGFLHSTKKHPMVHPYQKKILGSISGNSRTVSSLLPNATTAAYLVTGPSPEVGVNYGTVVERKDYEQWLSNVRAMHAIADEFGVDYVCFLQPVLGARAEILQPEEQAMLDETVAKLAPHRDYLSDVLGFYTEARVISGQYPYIVDLTDVLDGRIQQYEDSRHQTEEGGRTLASAILNHLKAEKLLQANISEKETNVRNN